MANMIIDFGKNKGKTIGECDEKYLKWLVSHEKVLALRNRWASRDAAFEIERRAVAAEDAASIARVQAAMAAEEVVETVARKVEWSLERCCYVYADTGECAAQEDKPTYRVVSLGTKKPRFDLVGHLTKSKEDKRNLLAECREIKARKRSADLGLKGHLSSNKGFQLMR